MNIAQPPLPFIPGPVSWTEPVECRFHQLRDVITSAERHGFRPVRLAVIDGGYRLGFERAMVITNQTAATIERKESFA